MEKLLQEPGRLQEKRWWRDVLESFTVTCHVSFNNFVIWNENISQKPENNRHLFSQIQKLLLNDIYKILNLKKFTQKQEKCQKWHPLTTGPASHFCQDCSTHRPGGETTKFSESQSSWVSQTLCLKIYFDL